VSLIAWIKDTVWPFLGGTVSTTWQWIKGATSKFIDWIYEIRLALHAGNLYQPAWEVGLPERVSIFVTWIRSIWNYLTGDRGSHNLELDKGRRSMTLSNGLKAFWTWIIDGVTTAWNWSLGKVDGFLLWIK